MSISGPLFWQVSGEVSITRTWAWPGIFALHYLGFSQIFSNSMIRGYYMVEFGLWSGNFNYFKIEFYISFLIPGTMQQSMIATIVEWSGNLVTAGPGQPKGRDISMLVMDPPRTMQWKPSGGRGVQSSAGLRSTRIGSFAEKEEENVLDDLHCIKDAKFHILTLNYVSKYYFLMMKNFLLMNCLQVLPPIFQFLVLKAPHTYWIIHFVEY